MRVALYGGAAILGFTLLESETVDIINLIIKDII